MTCDEIHTHAVRSANGAQQVRSYLSRVHDLSPMTGCHSAADIELLRAGTTEVFRFV